MIYGRTGHMIELLLAKPCSLTECDYIMRMIFKDVY